MVSGDGDDVKDGEGEFSYLPPLRRGDLVPDSIEGG